MSEFESSNIVDSSPRMKKMSFGKCPKYPFDELEVGKSFTLPIEGTNERSLRSQCTKFSKDGKRFKCIKHGEKGLLEVGRLS